MRPTSLSHSSSLPGLVSLCGSVRECGVVAGRIPVDDHPPRGLFAGVCDVQPVVCLVGGERPVGLPLAQLRPRVALPGVLCAVHLAQLRFRHAVLELGKHATRGDRGQLRCSARRRSHGRPAAARP